MRNETFLVYHYIGGENTCTDYVEAPSARQAVEVLGIDEADVIEVAKIVRDWKKSQTRHNYILENEKGHLLGVKATSEKNAIARANRYYYGDWHIKE